MTAPITTREELESVLDSIARDATGLELALTRTNAILAAWDAKDAEIAALSAVCPDEEVEELQAFCAASEMRILDHELITRRIADANVTLPIDIYNVRRIRALIASWRALHHHSARLMALLERLEWSRLVTYQTDGRSVHQCPICHGDCPKHAPDCRLAKAIEDDPNPPAPSS